MTKPHPKSMAAHFEGKDTTIVPVRSDGLHVFSWSPSPDASTPSTQVHVHFEVKAVNATFAVRFHSPATLTEFIDALVAHREDVWPKAKAS
jgi:hypothetical protein